MRVKLLLVALLVACGPKSSPQEPAVEADPLTPAQVVLAGKGAVEQYRQAYEIRALEGLTSLYSHGLDVLVVHQGRHYQGWTAVEKYLGDLISGSAEIHVSFADVSVSALGPEGAAVTAKMEREVSDGVTTIKEEGMFTLALRLVDERWLIVSEHFSYPPSTP